MKKLLLIELISILVLGCSQQNKDPHGQDQIEVYQNMKDIGAGLTVSDEILKNDILSFKLWHMSREAIKRITYQIRDSCPDEDIPENICNENVNVIGYYQIVTLNINTLQANLCGFTVVADDHVAFDYSNNNKVESGCFSENINHYLINDYTDSVIDRVRLFVIIPDNIDNRANAIVEVTLLPSMEVYDIKLIKSSGNSDYDNNVLQAIDLLRVFPPIPDGAKFTDYRILKLTFNPIVEDRGYLNKLNKSDKKAIYNHIFYYKQNLKTN